MGQVTGDDERRLLAHQIRPLFDIDVPHPFLLRPFSQSEIQFLHLWMQYYRAVIKQAWCPPSYCIDDFLETVDEEKFGPVRLRGTEDDERVLFQNLFVHAPSLHVSSAFARILGTQHMPSQEEKKLAFRETVLMHLAKTGVLPTWPDLKRYRDSRVFLPEVGLMAMSFMHYVKPGFGISDMRMESYVRFFFDVPGEITEDQLALYRDEGFSSQELLANYQDTHRWLRELFPNIDNIVPTPTDLVLFAHLHGGIEWRYYERWLHAGKKLGNQPNVTPQTMEWLRQESGVNLVAPNYASKYRAPDNFWTPELIRERYIEAWKVYNPGGWNPPHRIAGPVPRDFLKSYGKLQTMMKINQGHGKLDLTQCLEAGIPATETPSGTIIDQVYPNGFLGLLRDIEREFTREGAIVFDGAVQPKGLYNGFRTNRLASYEVPKAVAHYTPGTKAVW